MQRFVQRLMLAACALTVGAGLAAAEDGVAERQIHQRKRIAQGVRSGELTRPEAKRLARNAARLRRGIARDRRDGGVFTRRERIRAHRRLQQQNRAIRRHKHDTQSRN